MYFAQCAAHTAHVEMDCGICLNVHIDMCIQISSKVMMTQVRNNFNQNIHYLNEVDVGHHFVWQF
jgi:hypothetical protein